MDGVRYCFLVGHRAVGKTTLGAALARALGRPFIDLDAAIVERSGQTISAQFARSGESAFRALECETLVELLRESSRRNAPRPIVACGAGFPLDALTTLRRENDYVLWLRRPGDPPPMDLGSRPRLMPELTAAEEWERLVALRTPAYAAVADYCWEIAEGVSTEGAIRNLLCNLSHLMTAVRVTAPTHVDWTGTIAGSKSELLRALLLAAQARHPVRIHGRSACDDVRAMRRCLEQLGAVITDDGGAWRVEPLLDARRPNSQGTLELDVGASGAVARFLLPLLAKIPDTFVLRGTPRLHQRPMQGLIAAVRQLGVEVRCLERNGALPLAIHGCSPDTLSCRTIAVNGRQSSQFASALLLTAVGLPHGRCLDVTGPLVSSPYLEMSVDFLQRAGIDATIASAPPNATITATELAIEPDASSAAYLMAWGTLGGAAHITSYPRTSHQPDRIACDYFRQLGALVERVGDGVAVHHQSIRPFTINVGNCPDLAPLFAVCATFAVGTSRIAEAPHLRHKESNRIDDLVMELRRCAVDAEPQPDGMIIHGRGRGGIRHDGVVLDPHDDHRLAMSLALLALHGHPVTIRHPGVVTKSFPEYWLTLTNAGCDIAACPEMRSAPSSAL